MEVLHDDGQRVTYVEDELERWHPKGPEPT
jgi:hypothetical protein